jgi:hypothetical protein
LARSRWVKGNCWGSGSLPAERRERRSRGEGGESYVHFPCRAWGTGVVEAAPVGMGRARRGRGSGAPSRAPGSGGARVARVEARRGARGAREAGPCGAEDAADSASARWRDGTHGSVRGSVHCRVGVRLGYHSLACQVCPADGALAICHLTDDAVPCCLLDAVPRSGRDVAVRSIINGAKKPIIFNNEFGSVD